MKFAIAVPRSDAGAQGFLKSEPAAGVEVDLAHGDGAARAAGRTDAAGHIDIPITAGGQWRLHAVVRQRSTEPQAVEWERTSASLTFAVAEPSAPRTFD